ncbi:gp412 [Bacillus phage G]|uniref:Gp412 n=1 Tax=Bacillus phage G TaxID=2884420 RepID=G3MAF3_9CAUD|nr:gp412 [Bacillus phage G]AEO93670.1 gp412 [Bacillus phage G]
MKTFLIQTVNNTIRHDFCFQLVEAIEYNNWFYNDKTYNYVLSDRIVRQSDLIPIGSLEFVFNYLEKHHQVKDLRPINIPKELRTSRFLKRNVYVANKNEIVLTKDKFVKSNSRYKKFTDVTRRVDSLPDDEYIVSDLIDIQSEWRTLVYRQRLVGLQNYSGDFTLFPDVDLIEEMISSYKDCPPAYTLDVGVGRDGTFVIEVHPFISCGLYGFRDNKILPTMFVEAFNYEIKKGI